MDYKIIVKKTLDYYHHDSERLRHKKPSGKYISYKPYFYLTVPTASQEIFRVAYSVSDGGKHPKELNGLTDYLKPANLRFPLRDLKSYDIPNPGVYDTNLDSFLDYIRQKGWNGSNEPDFVTNKNLLKSVAASKTNLVYACRMNRVIFMINGGTNDPVIFGYGPVFELIMTDKSDDGTERKGVFEAKVSRGDDSFRIYYSGQIDGVTKHGGTSTNNYRHYELKLFQNTKGGEIGKGFWKDSSCIFFWQAFFGYCESLIFGFRTGEKKWKRIGPYHLYKITEMKVLEMPTKAAAELLDSDNKWTVEDGKCNLFSLLTFVKDNVTLDEDCFVFSKNSNDPFDWSAKRDEDGPVSEFREVIREKLHRDSQF
ncbi:hypothetical protein CRE_09006 [Caenorhabditis remanei]|uniref:Decapping nuclease n=1 Tax=Caenorhabditis remanei TaxID=31234 RepID=E3LIQ2_CAERE|nr:hypothetical protein CRE_09006 [Caenorhabditis remanei]